MKLRLRKLGEVIILILSIGIVLSAIYFSSIAYAAPHGSVRNHVHHLSLIAR